jgi:3-oxoacyl-[acyl-carrier-protein] synthase III
MINASINCISYYLPENILDNETLSNEHPGWTVDKISSKTGIYKRHIAKKNETASDLAFQAAELLFKDNNIDRNIIDFILFCTQSPDFFLPTSACVLQERLKIPVSCGALDFNLGCSGFVYGLGLAKGLVSSGQAKNVLLLTAETYSKYIHPLDKSNKTIFGDAAAATLITSVESNLGIGNFEYSTNGEGAEFLIVKNGAHRNKQQAAVDIFDGDTFVTNDDYLYMNGKEIFSFTAFNVPELIKKALIKNNLTAEEIDLFVMHQANEFMLQTIRKRAFIPPEKFYIHLADCGNTVSSTIPIALYHAHKEGKIEKGSKILIAGFGVGLSCASTVLTF